MTKQQFCNDPDVQDMASWMAQRFHNNPGWTHQYTKNGSLWTCDSLYDAFCQYEWNKSDWKTTKRILDIYRRDLKKALKHGNTNKIIAVCCGILGWGGIINNIQYINHYKCCIINEIDHMENVLSGNIIPSIHDISFICNNHLTECKMNAGFSKIYSILCDYCVMYDSRVGAALCLLVKQFCDDKKHQLIPTPNLIFSYLPWQSKHINRNPNKLVPASSNIKFPLVKYNLFFTEQVMRASWLLELALQKTPHIFSNGNNGFHELAAGLFMVGYNLE